MGRKIKINPIINKQVFKKAQGACRICGESDPALLDTHRIVGGSEGGRYTKFNSTCVCCRCHRKIHDGQIEIVGYFLSSSGKYLLQIIENQKERFV